MKKIEQWVRPNILNLNAYSSARDEFDSDDGVFLDANENPYGSLNRYPDPYQKKLKEKLSELKDIPPHQIFIGNGSDEVVDLAFRIFCEPGIEKALIFTPTYGMYEVTAAINNVDLIQLPLKYNFQMDLIQLRPFLNQEDLKMIIICSPNNPTGNQMNRQDIETILEQFRGVVLVDEAYIDFADNDSLVSLLEKYDHLIVSQTFSKAWGLAGARVGIAYAHAAIISCFNKVKPPYNVSQLNQEAAIKCLEGQELYQNNLSILLKERKALETFLSQLKMVRKIYASDANFLLVQVDDADELYRYLLDKKIVIRNRNKQWRNSVRITVGTPEENKKLIHVLKEYTS